MRAGSATDRLPMLSRPKQQSHLNQIPELTVAAPDVLPEMSLCYETGLPVQGDRCAVMREDTEAQLVQAALSGPVDGGGYQCRPDAAAAPVGCDLHADLAETHPARMDANLADDAAVGDRDQRAVERPVHCQRLNVDRGFGGDSVTFLGHRRQELRHIKAVSVLGGPNGDCCGCHSRILAHYRQVLTVQRPEKAKDGRVELRWQLELRQVPAAGQNHSPSARNACLDGSGVGMYRSEE